MRQALKNISHNPAKMGLKSFWTSTRFGRLHYIAPVKPKNKEVMLFIHGFGANWTIWTPLLRTIQDKNLLKSCDTLLVDLPSFGKSENKLNHLRSEEISEELLGLCKQLGYKKIRVTGHSMGGFVTLDLVARHPEILSAHVIAGTYFRIIRIANSPLKSIFRYPKLTFYYFSQTVISHSKLLTKVLNWLYKLLLGTKQKPVYALGGNSFLYASRNGIGYDTKKMWGAIKPPVHTVYGSADRLISISDMEELKSILPTASTEVIQGAGHSLLITHPEQVAKALY